MSENSPLELRIAISHLEFLKPSEKLVLEEKCSSLQELLALSLSDISLCIKRSLDTKLWPFLNLENLVKRDIFLMKKLKIGVLHCKDDAYPKLLSQIYDPPYLLFFRGDASILNNDSVGIIGSRHATKTAWKITYNFAGEVAKNGINVISGLATGIDSCAHKGCIESVHVVETERTADGSATKSACLAESARVSDEHVSDEHVSDVHVSDGRVSDVHVSENPLFRRCIGKTVAVLAGGLDSIYPKSNVSLASRILQDGGCLVSEYAPTEPPLQYHFPARNRIISGLSKAVIVMEAPPKSGALITADFAIEQDRELFFHQRAVDYDVQLGNEFLKNKNAKTANVMRYKRVLKYVEDGACVVQSVDEFLKALFNEEYIKKCNDDPNEVYASNGVLF